MKLFIKFFVIVFTVNIFSGYAGALDILYPQQKHHKTTSDVTYIMGNVSPSSELVINGEKVKVWKNGAFCKTVLLNQGNNTFKITETDGETVNSKEYTVNRICIPAQTSKTPKQPPKTETFENVQYATITKNGAPVRNSFSDNAERISHLPVNTVVFLDGKYKDWYKISTNEKNPRYWIHKSNVNVMYPMNNHPAAGINSAEFFNDRIFAEFKVLLDFPVMFKTEEKGSDIYLTLFGVKNIPALEKAIASQKTFAGLKIADYQNGNLTLYIPSNEPLWGYQADYEGNVFVFRRKNPPLINKRYPLKNITITIDPGHGGKELGAVGPTRIPEKDINLAISKELKTILEREGAKVIMTREDDSHVDLYARPDIANEYNSMICLSIHSNSIVDKDPYERHGVGTYYYHPQAKELANQIKLQMVKDLKLKDDGLRRASFVLTRPTMPLSVLVEVAYMPNPEEYLMLNNPNFQKRAAKSICEGLKNYLRNIKEE